MRNESSGLELLCIFKDVEQKQRAKCRCVNFTAQSCREGRLKLLFTRELVFNQNICLLNNLSVIVKGLDGEMKISHTRYPPIPDRLKEFLDAEDLHEDEEESNV